MSIIKPGGMEGHASLGVVMVIGFLVSEGAESQGLERVTKGSILGSLFRGGALFLTRGGVGSSGPSLCACSAVEDTCTGGACLGLWPMEKGCCLTLRCSGTGVEAPEVDICSGLVGVPLVGVSPRTADSRRDEGAYVLRLLHEGQASQGRMQVEESGGGDRPRTLQTRTVTVLRSCS
ncbi:MAG: hypothetical protein A6F72_09375 [Cycloclasticus sp. symbiont of Poecilosclerida sp. N]|nr:MAG: hypothetical protein A6F72_09375 [Cycloclasticus sp. symbiont of Poecilosclerida sp. N]